MRLSTLLKDIITLPVEADCEIRELSLDSRKVQPHALFFAMKGSQQDGKKYISDAIQKGSAAILIEAENGKDSLYFQGDTPIIPLPSLKKWVGKIAAKYYAYPANALQMVGVTGTSGKTSCTHFIAQLLHQLSIPCGLIGTLGSGFYGQLHETGLTTPDALTLQKSLKELLNEGAKAIAMEVSSHSIDQGRINDIPFQLGIFTNLSQDHLDYHGNMETYASVKKRFLTEDFTKEVIINVDDSYGKQWAKEIAKNKSVIAYATKKPNHFPAEIPLIYTAHLHFSLQGISATIHTPWGESDLHLPLVGEFNLSNAIATLTALCRLGIPFEKVITLLPQLQPVAGRMQALGGNDKPLVIVDYAHKPDALEKVLQVLRAHTRGKLICVFGCGGDRDQSKRPLMAKIAEQLADQVIVTNDNPRHEKPEAIAQHILSGFSHPALVSVMLDRSKAIEKSIQWASKDDCILIAGKGAEHYQQIGDQKYPFDDVERALFFLNNNA